MTEDEFREELCRCLEGVVVGGLAGPTGFEGLSVAIAGSDFLQQRRSLASAIESVADALNRIADLMEVSK